MYTQRKIHNMCNRTINKFYGPRVWRDVVQKLNEMEFSNIYSSYTMSDLKNNIELHGQASA